MVRKVEYVGTASVMSSGMESPWTLRALSTWSTLNGWFYGRIWMQFTSLYVALPMSKVRCKDLCEASACAGWVALIEAHTKERKVFCMVCRAFGGVFEKSR